MSSDDGMNPIENAPQGLDRAAFNVYDQPERHVAARLDTSGFIRETEVDDNHEASSSRLGSPSRAAHFAERLRTKLKSRTEDLVHPTPENHSPSDSIAAPCLAPLPSNSIDEDRLYHSLPEHKGLQAKDLIRNPISTVQSALHGASGAKFAQVADNQVVTHGENVGLVRAWDKLESAQNEKEKNDAVDELGSLKRERQDAYVRWTMDRHVMKVRQAPPRVLERPRRQDYRKADQEGKVEFQWADYGQQVRNLFDFHTP